MNAELPVLVVDDNREMRRVVESVLGFHGYSSHSLTSGEAALEYLDAHVAPYLCLIDVTLPGMSGQEVVAAMVGRRHPARVILMSGKGIDMENMPECVVGFLLKPFGFDELKSLLETYAD